MPCGKNETSLAPSQIQLFLSVINQQQAIQNIQSSVNLPVFKIRSALRELEDADYIELDQDQYALKEKGRASL